MNITILSSTLGTAVSAKGKPYQLYELAYKNNTFNGAIEGKKINQYSKVFKQVALFQPGETYEIQQEKNDGGFNEWVSLNKAAAGSSSPAPAANQQAPRTGAVATPAPRNTYETPEERAKKQVYIVRQSSIGAAIATLSTGTAKSAVKPEEVLDLAKRYEAFVFGTGATGFDDVPDFDPAVFNDPQID